MHSSRVVKVAVDGKRASGYEILPRLVLTAAHAVGDAGTPVTVTKLPSGPPRAGRVVWSGTPVPEGGGTAESRNRDAVDAALVEVEERGWQPAKGRVRWGRIVGERPRVPCVTWGFPRAPHLDGECEQIAGHINPGSGLVAGTYVIDCVVDRRRPPGGSPWSGMSGSAVFCENLLVGVVTADLPGHMPARLEAEPAVVLFQAEGFQEVLDRFGPGRRTLEPVEYVGLSDPDHLPHGGSVPGPFMELLHPGREIVPFHGRDTQLETLEDWSRRPGPAACVIHASGGQGKTRLARAFSHALPPDWAVLWLSPGEAGRIRVVPPPAVPLLVVVDGADGRVKETAELLEFAAQHDNEPGKVLLLARSRGWWTDRVRDEDCVSVRAAILLSDALEIALPALETGADAQKRAHREAARAFAEALARMPGRPHGAWAGLAESLATPEPSVHLGSPLTLHVTALVGLLDAARDARPGGPGGRPSRAAAPRDAVAEVEKQMLVHERRHWLRAAVPHRLQPALSEDALFDAMAAVVALCPEDDSEAFALLESVPRLRKKDDDRIHSVCAWIERVLPSSEHRRIGDLRPDRLAERFVGDRLKESRGLADAVLAGATPGQAARFLSLASRASLRGILAGELGDWCVRHRGVLGRPAMDVATEVEDPAPLLAALEAVVDDSGVTVAELENLAAHLPESTHNLAPWGLRLSERIATVRRERARHDPDAVPGLAVALRQLSKRLWRMGETVKALETVQEAIGLWEQDPEPGPDVWPELGGCHNNAALFHSRLGRRQEALDAAGTAVGVLRRAARSNEPEALDHLSRGLSSLAAAESALGHREAALRAARECLEIRSGLAADNAQFTHLSADGLQNHAVYLMESGHRAEALTAARQAVAHYEVLADESPDAFLPGLALTLATLSSAARLMGLRQEALDAARRAVSIRRTLDAARPEVYRPDLAGALHHLSIDLADLGQHDEALAAVEKSVELFRGLADERPSAHGPRLALALNSLAYDLSACGHHVRALKAAEEAVQRYEELAAKHGGAFHPELAMACITFANSLDHFNRPADARDALDKAASLLRDLADDSPAAFRPDLATCLNNLAGVLRRTGDTTTALTTVDEAIAINDKLSAEKDGAEAEGFADNLARNWLVKYACLLDLGRHADAGEAGAKAVRRLQALAASAPDLYEGDLFHTLVSLSALARTAGRHDDADRHMGEATDVGRRLAERDPARSGARLAAYLEDWGNHLNLLDRRAESLEVAAEAAALCRSVLEYDDTCPARLARARAAMVLGDRLMRCGRPADALRSTRQAVAGLRALYTADPAEHAPLLSAALSQLSFLLLHAGKGDAAMEAGAESVLLAEQAAVLEAPCLEAADQARADSPTAARLRAAPGRPSRLRHTRLRRIRLRCTRLRPTRLRPARLRHTRLRRSHRRRIHRRRTRLRRTHRPATGLRPAKARRRAAPRPRHSSCTESSPVSWGGRTPSAFSSARSTSAAGSPCPPRRRTSCDSPWLSASSAVG